MGKYKNNLPAKMTGEMRPARYTIPEYLWEQAKPDFTAFHARLKGFAATSTDLLDNLNEVCRFEAQDDRGFYEELKRLGNDSAKAGLIGVCWGAFTDLDQLEEFALLFNWEPTAHFALRAMNSREKLYIGGQETISGQAAMIDLAKTLLVRLEGAVDEDGDKIELKFTKSPSTQSRILTEKCANRLPQHLLLELLQVIKDDSTVTEEEEEAVVFTSTSPTSTPKSVTGASGTTKPN